MLANFRITTLCPNQCQNLLCYSGTIIWVLDLCLGVLLSKPHDKFCACSQQINMYQHCQAIDQLCYQHTAKYHAEFSPIIDSGQHAQSGHCCHPHYVMHVHIKNTWQHNIRPLDNMTTVVLSQQKRYSKTPWPAQCQKPKRLWLQN